MQQGRAHSLGQLSPMNGSHAFGEQAAPGVRRDIAAFFSFHVSLSSPSRIFIRLTSLLAFARRRLNQNIETYYAHL